MTPLTQLVNTFSPIPVAAQTGRSTPNSVGEVVSGRSSASTVNSGIVSNGEILFNVV